MIGMVNGVPVISHWRASKRQNFLNNAVKQSLQDFKQKRRDIGALHVVVWRIYYAYIHTRPLIKMCTGALRSKKYVSGDGSEYM